MGRTSKLKFYFCICWDVLQLFFFVLLMWKNKESCKEVWERCRGDGKEIEKREQEEGTRSLQLRKHNRNRWCSLSLTPGRNGWVRSHTWFWNHPRHRGAPGRHLHTSTTSSSLWGMGRRTRTGTEGTSCWKLEYWQVPGTGNSLQTKFFITEAITLTFHLEIVSNLEVGSVLRNAFCPYLIESTDCHGAAHSPSVYVLGSALGSLTFLSLFSPCSIKTSPYTSHTENLLLTDNSRGK